MKFNKWTMGLAAIGVVSLASAARADEKLSQVQTALSNTTLSGYVDTSAQWNLGSQNNNNANPAGIPSYAFGGIGKADGFNLNAVDIALDKPLDESPWAAGYHVELMFGQDGGYVTGVSFPSAIRQAYISLRTPVGNSGIDWKVGVWDTIIGYESTSDPLNPNYTRSYGYSIEPKTHTGILATYKVNDMVSLSAGVADTWTGINGRATYETQKTYMGAIALTAPDSWGWVKGATLNAGVINADSGSASSTGAGKTSLYAGVTVPTPLTALKVGAAFDYLESHNGAGVNPSDDSAWAGALYANFQANDKLSFNLRGELLDDEGGATLLALPPSLAGHTIEAATATVSYQLWANVLSRVELRWDHANSGAFDNSPTGTNIHRNAFLLALNLIYQF
jgi:hypothetical protein